MGIEVTIDGKACEAALGETILDAARRAGVAIPTLCHHPAVGTLGACRVCVVEVERRGRARVATSCNYPLAGGEVVRTGTARVRRLRRLVVELLLPLAPRSPALQRLARGLGVRRSRFAATTPRTDCILCGLCVAVCRERARADAIDFAARGARRIVRTPFGQEGGECVACGACGEVCPTRAVAMERDALSRLARRTGKERWCRYHLMGIAPGTVCAMNYDCPGCQVDQELRAAYGGNPFLAPEKGWAESDDAKRTT